MKNKNHEAVAKPYYRSTPSNETRTNHKHLSEDSIILHLQQLAKQMERKYPKGYQGL